MRFDGPSQILILPTTFEPGDEAAFTFRVFSRSSGLRMKVVFTQFFLLIFMIVGYYMELICALIMFFSKNII